MARYVVIGARREPAADGSHSHVTGVCVPRGLYYSRDEVIASLARGDVWELSGTGDPARLTLLAACPAEECDLSPYVTSVQADGAQATLETLEGC